MKVLLIGCGRMGQRYVAALTSLFPTLELTTVDPTTKLPQARHHYAYLEEVARQPFELAIDAATNDRRGERFERLVDWAIPHILIEKPHAQSLRESAHMLAIAARSKARVMVPFYRRFATHYAPSTLAQLGAGRLTGITITSGAIGIGCNGVHYLDLANYLFSALPLGIFADLSFDSIGSPRGSQFSDFGGTIYLRYANGYCNINVDPNSSRGVVVDLSFEFGKLVIHKQQEPRWFWYARDGDDRSGPMSRTHLEREVRPAVELNLDLLDLIGKGLQGLLGDGVFPSLAEGHVVLNQVQTAFDATRSASYVPFVMRDEGADIFNFT